MNHRLITASNSASAPKRTGSVQGSQVSAFVCSIKVIMNQNPGNLMLFLTFILGMNLVVSSVATAESIPQNDKTAKPENSTLVSTYQNSSNVESSLDTDSIDQITSVSQLSDVQPTDWAFQALRSLFERYGVIAGYPDGTFRGNQAMTRYEFAVALNTALNRVNQLIASGNSNIVTQEDLATLRKLQEDFA
ncbi:MAG TPA: iron uptake porin, partial [Candidatus Obscuribacterales bacterium]